MTFLKEGRKVDASDAQQLAQSLNASYFEVSAKDYVNVEESFIEMSRFVSKNTVPYNQKKLNATEKVEQTNSNYCILL